MDTERAPTEPTPTEPTPQIESSVDAVMDRSALPWREAVRALVVDPDRRVLLVHFDFEAPEIPHGFWACPGGGKDPGESDVDALQRELREEVGLELTEVGEPIWDKNGIWPAGPFRGQHDVYYLVRTDHFEPRGLLTNDELKVEHVDDIRWWSWDELSATYARFAGSQPDEPGYTVFSPRNLIDLLDMLLVHGPPATPVRIEAAEGTASTFPT